MFKKKSFSRAPKSKPKVVSKVVNEPKPILSECSKKEKIDILSEPIKSASDKKLYKTIRLENGLTALLISDQESDGSKSVQSASSDQHDTKTSAELYEEKLNKKYITKSTRIPIASIPIFELAAKEVLEKNPNI